MNLKKIADIAKELQTDELKMFVFNCIKNFVWKNQQRYFPHYQQGFDKDELIYEFFYQFTRDKKHRDGQVYSELDRFQYEKLGGEDWDGSDEKKLAAYIQRFVINRLMDKERMAVAHPETHYAGSMKEQDDDAPRQPTLDFLVNKAAKSDPSIEDIEITPDMLLKARDIYDEMPKEDKYKFLRLYESVKNTLPENLKYLFSDLVGNDKAKRFSPRNAESSGIVSSLEDNHPNIEIESYKLDGKPALRITTKSLENGKLSESDISLLNEEGYNFYTSRGGKVYYVKAS